MPGWRFRDFDVHDDGMGVNAERVDCDIQFATFWRSCRFCVYYFMGGF